MDLIYRSDNQKKIDAMIEHAEKMREFVAEKGEGNVTFDELSFKNSFIYSHT